jgi:hypothetical protein
MRLDPKREGALGGPSGPVGLRRGMLRTAGFAQFQIGFGVSPNQARPWPDASGFARAEGPGIIACEMALELIPQIGGWLASDGLRELVEDAFDGAEARLSRADALRVDERGSARWVRAASDLLPQPQQHPALLGLVVLAPRGAGNVDFLEASWTIDGDPADLADIMRIRVVDLVAGDAAAGSLGGSYRLSPGDWMRLTFVRAWMKPDILLSEALAPSTVTRAPPHVQLWLGMETSLPSSLEALLGAEEAAVRGALRNVHGRGT